MNITGIIAEYNPFHGGHSFHIKEAKKQTGADYCVVVMSGDFVQRGGTGHFQQISAHENGACQRGRSSGGNAVCFRSQQC